MFRSIAHRGALVAALTLSTVPVSRMQAQSVVATPSAVTGGDPQPTGNPPKPKAIPSDPLPITLLTVLAVLGVA